MDSTDDDFQAPKVAGAPDAIWLVYGDLDSDVTHDECRGGVTWCEDNQFASDVRYVRADLVDAAVAAERERWTEAVMAELDGNGQAKAIVAEAIRKG